MDHSGGELAFVGDDFVPRIPTYSVVVVGVSRFAVTLYVNAVWDKHPHQLATNVETAKQAAEQVSGEQLDAVGPKHRLRATVRDVSGNAHPGETPQAFYRKH